MTSNDNNSTTAVVDEKELMVCIRALVIASTQNDHDEGDAGVELLTDETSVQSGDSNNPEYQVLIHQVEEKLTLFLEEQVRRCNRAERDLDPIENRDQAIVLPIHKAHAYPCRTTHKSLPSPPTDWPQRPVMLRPTPHTSTKIRGIRHASDRDYRHFSGFCAGCILPVNTGHEQAGKSLVIDFESNHFVGTLLIRIKGIVPAEKDPTTTTQQQQQQQRESTAAKGYFDHRKRRFQGIVKGKFKTALPMSECVTGQIFERSAGRMPAKWVVSTFIKFVSTLAPQLETTLEGDNPRFLMPLSATAHTVLTKPHKAAITQQEKELQDKLDTNLFNYSVYLGATQSIEEDVQEPPASDETSIMQELPQEFGGGSNLDSSKSRSLSSRMSARKKAFNAVSAKKSKVPCFSLDKEYTFEFYQHLLIFDEPEFTLDMGRPIGKVPLSPITDGQPIKFMSAHKDPVTGKLDTLWSFDIWHESMYDLAQAAANKQTR